MGASVHIFPVDKDRTVYRFPFVRYQRFLDRAYSIPQFAGERLRYIELIVEVNRHALVRVCRTINAYLILDDSGFLDTTMWLPLGALTLDRIQIPGAPRRDGSVVNATADFAQRRYEHEATWKATDQI